MRRLQASSVRNTSIEHYSSTVGDSTMKEINALFEQSLLLEAEGKYAAAEPIFMQALQMKEKMLGVTDPDLASDYYNAGLLFLAQDKYQKAEEYLVRSLRLDEQKLGADHSELLSTLEHLAEVYFNQGSYDKAEKIQRRFLDLHARTRGQQGAEIVSNLYNLAEICDLLGKPVQANEVRLQAQRLISDELSMATRKAS
ncbi:MAG TPA: tetratricopeptide repeat protein [Candidatus Obscuribacterales bacterium]